MMIPLVCNECGMRLDISCKQPIPACHNCHQRMTIVKGSKPPQTEAKEGRKENPFYVR